MQATSSRGRHRASVAYISLSFSGCHHTSYETSPYEKGDITIQVTSSREHQHVPPPPSNKRGLQETSPCISLQYISTWSKPHHSSYELPEDIIVHVYEHEGTSLTFLQAQAAHHLTCFKLQGASSYIPRNSRQHHRASLERLGMSPVRLYSTSLPAPGDITGYICPVPTHYR